MFEITNPRTQIMYLAAPLVRGVDEVTEKIQQIRAILDENPGLRHDLPLQRRVGALMKKSGPMLEQFHFLGSSSQRRISLTKDEIDPATFWERIEKEGIEELVIDDTFVYEGRVLQELIKMRPSPDFLTQNYTLKFADGEELTETAAKLLLCGDTFKGMLESNMRETQDRVIDFSESVSLYGFIKVLEAVETGAEYPEDVEGLYKLAKDYLAFVLYPEGTFGPAEWEQHYGLKIDDLPVVPKGIMESLNKPCPYTEGKTVSETHSLFLVPKGLSLDKMNKLAQAPKEGHGTKYIFYWGAIKSRHGSPQVEKSYWALMLNDVIPESRGKTRQEQLALASRVEGNEAPSLLEAVVCNAVEYVKNENRLFSVNPWIYTCCREEPIGETKLVVGGFSSGGLRVHGSLDNSDVGVSVVRRK